MRGAGIIPDFLVCRLEKPQNLKQLRQKLHLLTSISERRILMLENVGTVYQVPLLLEKQSMPGRIARWAGSRLPANMKPWQEVLRRASKKHQQTIKVAMIAKYLDNLDTYLSLTEAMSTAAWYADVNLDLTWVNAEKLEKMSSKELVSELQSFDGILVPGGFGERGIKGMIKAATYAIQNNIPYLGICLGMQILTIAFARLNGLKQANSKEFAPKGRQLVVTFLEGQQNLHSTGGSMRLGSYQCRLVKGSLARRVYGKDMIQERHRHRFEFNPKYTKHLTQAGLAISGVCPQNDMVEIVELPDKDYCLGCQFHPEFASRPTRPQPLILSFLQAVKKKQT